MYNTNTGVRTSTETGSDAYSLNDHGTDSVGYFNQTLTGTDAYTTVATRRSRRRLHAHHQRLGGYTLVENDDGDDPVTTTGNHSFTTTGSGNYVDGQVALSASGRGPLHALAGLQQHLEWGLGDGGDGGLFARGIPLLPGQRRGGSDGRRLPVGGHGRRIRRPRLVALPALFRRRHAGLDGRREFQGDRDHPARRDGLGRERPRPGRAGRSPAGGGGLSQRPGSDPGATRGDRLPSPSGRGAGGEGAQGLAQAGRGGRGHREAHEESVAGVAILDAPPADGVIRTTPNHPFYVRDRGWVQRDLRVDARFRSRDGGESELVGALDAGTVEGVFNLHVRGCRTYFVAGDDDRTTLLVHNDSANPAGLFTGAAPPLDFDLKGAALTLNYTNGPDGGIVVQIPGAGQTNSFLADPNWTLPFELGELNGTTSPGVAAGQPGAGVGDSLPLPEVPHHRYRRAAASLIRRGPLSVLGNRHPSRAFSTAGAVRPTLLAFSRGPRRRWAFRPALK